MVLIPLLPLICVVFLLLRWWVGDEVLTDPRLSQPSRPTQVLAEIRKAFGMPDEVRPRCPYHTVADLRTLRAAAYAAPFSSLGEGVRACVHA